MQTIEPTLAARAARTRRRIWLAGSVAALTGCLGFWLGPAEFSRWKRERLVTRAQEALAQNDIPTAVISLRRVLLVNPDDLGAMRALAEIATREAPRDALPLRERICKLAPASPDDALAWADLALELGEFTQAEEALSRAKVLPLPSARFHRLSARLASDSGRNDEAAHHLHAALELDPASDRDRLELAALEVVSPDAGTRAGAQAVLLRLRENPPMRRAATRALLADAIRREHIEEAMPLAKEIVRSADAEFTDRLQYLALLRIREHPQATLAQTLDPQPLPLGVAGPAAATESFSSYLNDLREQARGDAMDAARLIAFLNSISQPLLAVDWAASLPAELRALPPVAPTLAEAFSALREWDRLDRLVSDGSWGAADYLRVAFAARVSSEQGRRQESSARWASAVKLTDYRPERLTQLGRMAAGWGWRSEWEELAWTAAKTSTRARESLLGLAAYYRQTRDTSRLLAVWTQLLESDPKDPVARKNWARLSFLLKTDAYRTGAVAEELYRQQPADPEIATTYALVQHQRELYSEALAIFQRLPAEQLRSPLIAGFYGVVLLANRQPKEAAEFLTRAKDAPLLREEEAIVTEARRKLD